MRDEIENDCPEIDARTRELVVSYLDIRRAIGLSGLLLPIALGPIGAWVFGVEFQDNLSSYYHTPLRDVFVGTLCAIGIFLFCYRGYDRVEDWTANLGCVGALGVALLPLDAKSGPLYQQSLVGTLHCVAGGLFFITLAFYSLWHFPSSKRRDPTPLPQDSQRDLVYRASGVVIVLATLLMGIYFMLQEGPFKSLCDQYNALLWLEWTALWAFAAAWLTKGRVIVANLAIGLLEETQRVVTKRFPKRKH